MSTHNHNQTANSASDSLRRVAEETFESLAFMFSMPEPEEPKAIVNVGFTGPSNGTLRVTVSASMLPQLAVNMMGIPDGAEPAIEQQVDALKELGNVICGNILPAIAGAAAEFSIAPPEAVIGNQPAPGAPSARKAAGAHLALDSGIADLALYMDPPTAGA